MKASQARESNEGVSIHVLPYAPTWPKCHRSITKQIAFMPQF